AGVGEERLQLVVRGVANLDRCRGMAGREARQQPRQPEAREAEEETEADEAAHLAALVHDRVERAPELSLVLAEVLGEEIARAGEDEAAAGAFEQLDAQRRLERRHALAHRRARDREPAGRRAHAAALGDDRERLQLVEIDTVQIHWTY